MGAVASWAAIGVAIYAAVVAALRLSGFADDAPGPAVGWTARDVIFVVVAAGAALAGRRAHATRAEALIGAGMTFFVLGLLDMHVFGLFEVAAGNLVADAIFHGSGSVAVTIGLALQLRSQTLRTT